MTSHYTAKQITLHWTIAGLFVTQFLLHEPIVQAWDDIQNGLPFAFNPLVAAHVFGGLLVFALALWRIRLRFTLGVPALPENEPKPLKFAAHATHLGLYGLMILMPITGAIAWFGSIQTAATAHALMKPLLLLLFFLHVCGALFQQLVLKTNIMARMTRSG